MVNGVGAATFEFVMAMTVTGAVGFRLVSRHARRLPDLAEAVSIAERRAARIGLVAGIGTLLTYGTHLSDLSCYMLGTCLAVLGFGITSYAAGSNEHSALRRAGWALAIAGALSECLVTGARAFETASWSMMLHPVHLLAAGSWLGTLAVLAACTMSPMARSRATRASRTGAHQRLRLAPQSTSQPTLRPPEAELHALWADCLRHLAPLAGGSATTLALTGMISASRHFRVRNPVHALITGEYGQVLIMKLLLVGMVASLGAWNAWHTRRSSIGEPPVWSLAAELTAAVVVVVMAAVLVTLPRAA